MSSGVEEKCINTETPAMDNIYKIMTGMNIALVVQCAVELGIFDLVSEIEGVCTAQKLAEKNSFNSDATERLLNALTALNLIEKTISDGAAQYNLTDSGKLLAKENPLSVATSMGGPCSFYNPRMFSGLADIVKGLKTGSEHGHHHWHGHGHEHDGNGHGHGHGHEHGGHDHKEQHEFGKVENPATGEAEGWRSTDMFKGMHNSMLPVAGKLLTAFDLSCHKSVVDLGGGSGVLSYELKRQYPDMEVYLNDQDHVVKVAKEHFYKGNEHLDVKFLPGDFKKIDIPKVDLFLMSQVFHHVDKPEEFLDTLHKKLNPGGAILLVENLLKEKKDGPISTTMWDLMMLNHAGPGSTMRQRSPSEYQTLFTKHGFKDVKVARTQEYCEHDVIYAKKA